MKTAKEFIEKLQNDEAFAKLVNDGIQKKKDAGAQDYTEALIPVAAELGYEITAEQVEALRAKQNEAVSEEELGKAAGGTSCLAILIASGVAASVIGSSVGISIGVSEAVDAAREGSGC